MLSSCDNLTNPSLVWKPQPRDTSQSCAVQRSIRGAGGTNGLLWARVGGAAEASVSNKPRISQAGEEVPGGSEGPALRADGARQWCGARAGGGGGGSRL